jgi:hypothetical protein
MTEKLHKFTAKYESQALYPLKRHGTNQGRQFDLKKVSILIEMTSLKVVHHKMMTVTFAIKYYLQIDASRILDTIVS